MFRRRGETPKGFRQRLKEHFTPWRIILDVSDVILATAMALAMCDIIKKELFIIIFAIYVVVLILYLIVRFKNRIEKELGLNGRNDDHKQ